MLIIAVSKGRVSKKFIEMLEALDYTFPDLNSRQLVVRDSTDQIALILVKADDVPTYVERSVAQLGVVGNDVLLEGDYSVYELLDLGIGKCRMCLAGPKGLEFDRFDFVSIASKYPQQSRNYLKETGKLGSVTKLNGSVELAPIVGISDFIIDLVETGKTLEENDLVVYETITQISSRLIANRVAFKTQNDEIKRLIDRLKEEPV
ncbi:MAG: phosphoribosyltransferase [Clostridiales bacterium]|jgi:ATP phosphoribosyltransferase|nr:phosphoribosyltransferase [Clostridiales bacterium]